MLNKIPIVGWLLTTIAAIGLSVPFWFFWTYMGIGVTYFYFVPVVFQSIPFIDCFGLFIIISILKGTLIPQFVNISNSQKIDK